MALNRTVFASFLVWLLLQAASAGAAQKPLKLWIMFKDKNGTPFSLSKPGDFLTQKSVERRTKYNLKFHESDLPVTPSYVSQVEAIDHSKVLFVSKWFNGVVIQIDSADWQADVLSKLGNLPFVSTSRQVKRYWVSYTPDNLSPGSTSTTQRKAAADTGNVFNYGGSETQVTQLGLQCLHNKGFRGQGMTIAVMDAGFGFVNTNPIYDSLRNRGGILGTWDFAEGKADVYSQGTHGSMVMSCMAANNPGSIMGTAPMANYWLFRTEEGPETISEEYNWIRAAEFADSVGADILTTSLGYTEFDKPEMNHKYADLNGRTAPMSIAATMAARKGMLVLNAAGNERAGTWHYISVPADADSIIAVGSVDGNGKDSPFSGVGPSSDGRIKPDLVARGEGSWVTVDMPDGFPGNGTSFACPVLAGAVACYWQAYKEFDNMSILYSLKHFASLSSAPDNFKGYGIPDLCVKPLLSPVIPQKIEEFDFKAYASGDHVIVVEITNNHYDYMKLEVTDLAGHIHMSQEVPKDTRVIKLDAQTLSEGVYVITLRSSQGTISRKVLKD